jgi:hypothetical protein
VQTKLNVYWIDSNVSKRVFSGIFYLMFNYLLIELQSQAIVVLTPTLRTAVLFSKASNASRHFSKPSGTRSSGQQCPSNTAAT